MRRQINQLMDASYDRHSKRTYGHAINRPYMHGNIWVVDVIIDSEKKILTKVQIAEMVRNTIDFINIGTPVVIQKNAVGQAVILGISDRQKNNANVNKIVRSGVFLNFTRGWKKESGQIVTPSNNTPTPGTADTKTYGYRYVLAKYGELVYGVTPYGYGVTEQFII